MTGVAGGLAYANHRPAARRRIGIAAAQAIQPVQVCAVFASLPLPGNDRLLCLAGNLRDAAVMRHSSHTGKAGGGKQPCLKGKTNKRGYQDISRHI